jgi:hypothetical protein
MKKTMLMLLLLATTLPIAGCIVAPYPGYYGYYGGRGGCYYHPYRCY